MSLRSLRFCLFYLGAMLAVAIATGTWRASIAPEQLLSYGMSPLDLRSGAWWRLVSSAFVTHGAGVFWGSMLVAGLSIGLAERRFGTRHAWMVFLAAHVGSLIVVSLLVVLPLELAGSELGRLLADTRDVGGSAGYYGCLGLGIAGLTGPRRRWAHAAMLLILAGRLGFSIWFEVEHTTLHGDLAHPIAYLAGMALARVWSLTRAPQPPLAR